MELLNVFANPILPVFAIMALGFILGRAGWISVAEARVVNRITLTVLLPVFLFDVSSRTDIARFSLLPIATYLVVELAVFMVGFALAFYVMQREASESLLLGMTGVVANNAFYSNARKAPSFRAGMDSARGEASCSSSSMVFLIR